MTRLQCSAPMPPAGYDIIIRGSNQYLVRQDCKAAFESLGTNSSNEPIPLAGTELGIAAGGRGTTLRMALPGLAQDTVIIRKSLRGGILRKLLGRSYFGFRTRMFDEAGVTAYAHSMGLPVPEVLIAAREPILPFLYRGWMATAEIQNCQDLATFLRNLARDSSRDHARTKQQIISQLAGIIADMHDCRIIHGDLHLKNILIQPHNNGFHIFLLDFDKSYMVNRMTMKLRFQNLVRLFRSVLKRRELACFFDAADIRLFLRVYFRHDPDLLAASAPALRQACRTVYLHSLWWRLTGRRSWLHTYAGLCQTGKKQTDPLDTGSDS